MSENELCRHGLHIPTHGTCIGCEVDKRLDNIDSFIEHCRDGIEKCFERIEKIENDCKNGYMYQKGEIEAFHERIKEIEDELMKCSEWSEKSEIKLNGLVNLFDVVNKKQDGNSIKIEKLETHIEKVHDLVNLEDRITR